MEKLLLQVFLSPFPEINNQQSKLIYEYSCAIPENFGEIQDKIIQHLGEGFRSESNKVEGNCFLTIYLLWDRALEPLKTFFEQFQAIEKFNLIEKFFAGEQDYVIQVDAELLTDEDLAALQQLLNEENVQSPVLQAKQISEWGASGYFDQLMIKLAVDLTKEVIFTLAKKIKKLLAGKSISEVTVVNIRQEIKKELILEYQLSHDEIYLSTFRKYSDNSQLLIYKSNMNSYRVKLDANSNVISMSRT